MGEQASTMAQCRLSLLILLVSLVQISQSRKTAETGGGAGGEGGGTCQEVYITIYQQGVTDKIGLDYGQAEDDGVTMISSLLAGYGCTNATAEGHEPYFENTCDDDDDYDILDRMGLCYHTTNRNHNIRDPVHRECSDVGSLDCASSCAHIAGAGYANVRIMAASHPTH